MRKTLVCLFIGVVLTTTIPARAADDTPDAKVNALLQKLEKVRQRHDVAAVGLTLVRNNQVLFAGGLGVRDWDAPLPITANTLFRVGSITKSFTGITALRMARESPDLLQCTVAEVLGPVLEDRFESSLITLQNLLEHTAGLHDLSRNEFTFQGEFVTFADAIKIEPATRVLAWPANLHSSYSNAGYGLAGYLLETRAKQPYEELVEQHVLAPLYMNDSGFYRHSDSPPLAAGYNRDGKTPIPYWHMIYRSFGGLNTTPNDMSKFLRALANRQPPEDGFELLTEKEQRRFENPQTTLSAEAGLDYGYGLGSYHWFHKKVRFHGHGGDADGYLSHYGYNRESGLGYFVVITAFNHAPLAQMREHIEDYLVAQTSPLEEKGKPLEKAQLKQWVGEYVAATERFNRSTAKDPEILHITLRRGQLFTDYRGAKKALVPVRATQFRRSWQPDATYAFVKDAQGHTYLQGDLGNFRKLKPLRR